MTLILNDSILQQELDTVMTLNNGLGLLVHLFQNSYTPTHGDTPGSFTECTFLGYAAQTLPTMGSSTVSGSVATSVAGSGLVYTSSDPTPQNIYGYYVTDIGNTQVYWAELNPAGVFSITNGNSFTVNMQRTYKSQF